VHRGVPTKAEPGDGGAVTDHFLWASVSTTTSQPLVKRELQLPQREMRAELIAIVECRTGDAAEMPAEADRPPR
jgi:hypothetical protein